MDDKQLLVTTDEAAELLRVSASALLRWRRVGVGPAWVRPAGTRRVVYRRTAIEAWLAEQEAATSSNSSRPTH